ncbi:OmpA family protein [Phyllobacterium sp. P30BS-XVII]|uniref:OmpA family protein n=1 Tax=Phyllobacterium sp. P30BS-XVII TaxID=2587046 RepID=UPI0015F85CC9|nr:OmpA family protein [Phyllobacterium sp. P30BS-XVII]MBA8900213.1 outer membrane protein OmpA-like peptidoglycan-associated protein [Phyllobacterium sp. P30BS-XVII]
MPNVGSPIKGAIHDYSTVERAQIRLTGFAISSSVLTDTHKTALDQKIVPILKAGGSVSIAGLASRSGGTDFNSKLSTDRAYATYDYLKAATKGVVRARVGEAVYGQGESVAAASGVADGTEDAFYRAVEVSAWTKITPPPLAKPSANAAPAMIRRVVYARAGNPSVEEKGFELQGSKWADLADAIMDHKLPVQKKYAMVPKDWVLIEIHETSYNNREPYGNVTLVTDVTEHDYIWGPKTPQVLYTHKSLYMFNGKRLEDRSMWKKRTWHVDPPKFVPRDKLVPITKKME